MGLTPEHKLASAVLMLAIGDYWRFYDRTLRRREVMGAIRNLHGQTRRDRMTVTLDRLQEKADAAREWISGAKAPLPFQLIAEAFGWEPDRLSTAILSPSTGVNLRGEERRSDRHPFSPLGQGQKRNARARADGPGNQLGLGGGDPLHPVRRQGPSRRSRLWNGAGPALPGTVPR